MELDALALAKILEAPGDAPGFARRIGKGLALAMNGGAPVDVDTGAMSASAVISTGTPDRSGDVMIASGCRLDNYRFNPVVFWEHQLDFRLPIAKSEDPAGNWMAGLALGFQVLGFIIIRKIVNIEV